MLLSNKELREKLNAKQDKAVIAWLNKHRVKWWRDTKKHPITTVGEIERAQVAAESEEVSF
jgi:hypothetical protein